MENAIPKKPTLREFFKKNWMVIFGATCVLAIIFANILRLITPPPTVPIRENTWNGITPGFSSTEQVIAKLGTPVSTEVTTDGTKLLYNSDWQRAKNEVVVEKNGKVSYMKEFITYDPENTLEKAVATLGDFDIKMYGGDFSELTPAYVFLNKGLIIFAQENGGALQQKWYFTPTTKEQFLVQFQNTLSEEAREVERLAE